MVDKYIRADGQQNKDYPECGRRYSCNTVAFAGFWRTRLTAWCASRVAPGVELNFVGIQPLVDTELNELAPRLISNTRSAQRTRYPGAETLLFVL